MKTAISFLCIMALLLLMFMTVFAGDVPESLLHEDDAQVFFAEVIYFHPDKENPYIELSPVKVIKGDVKTYVKHTYYNPNPVGGFKVKEGNVYLFTYFDENNPTNIFEASSYDTSSLKLKNVSGDMWKRFERYLNNGEFEKAEKDRVDRKNKTAVKTGETITLTEYAGFDLDNTKSSVSIYSGPLGVEVERGRFLEISDEIVLEKIKPEPADVSGNHSIIISLSENMQAVYISSDCKVNRKNTGTSPNLQNEYIIKAEDMAKISQLLETEHKLPPMRKISIAMMVAFVLVFVLVIVFVVKKKNF